ncbi:MAG: GvpL/GvpF family gas vesicle protein, partial [Nocardioidaceae bacterium]
DATYYDRIRLGELVAQAVDVRRERDAESIVAALAPHVEDYVLRETSGMDGLVELAVLVSSDDVARLEQAAESVAEAFAGRAELNLVGPTALYDFVPEQ